MMHLHLENTSAGELLKLKLTKAKNLNVENAR